MRNYKQNWFNEPKLVGFIVGSSGGLGCCLVLSCICLIIYYYLHMTFFIFSLFLLVFSSHLDYWIIEGCQFRDEFYFTSIREKYQIQKV